MSWFEILHGFGWLLGLYGLKFKKLSVSTLVLYLCSYNLVGSATSSSQPKQVARSGDDGWGYSHPRQIDL
jgi:hypothetical protein